MRGKGKFCEQDRSQGFAGSSPLCVSHAVCVCIGLLWCATHTMRADWSMHRGNPRLDGVSMERARTVPKPGWRFSAAKAVKGGAAITGGRVFVGDEEGVFHALELSSGKAIWSFKTEGPIEATPLVLGKSVMIGSTDGRLYALDVDTGAKHWVYETGDKIVGGANYTKSPDGKADWVLVGSYDASLHCVDAATGKCVWTSQTDNFINGTPALLPGGEIIFGGCDSMLRIVSVKDGKQERQIEADSYVASSVAVAADGKAYVGHHGNAVLGLDPAQARVLWTYRDRGFPYLSSAAVSGDRVFIGGNDKRLHCIGRSDGKSLWQFSTRGKVDGSPVVCVDTVVVGSQDGRLYGVAVEDGTERWMLDLGAPVVASPAVSDGWIVIGTEDGVVHALQLANSKP